MQTENSIVDTASLSYLGITNSPRIFWNLPVPTLIEKTILHLQGNLTINGALSIDTGKFKGRSPQDRFVVKDAVTADKVWWNDQHNFPLESDTFDVIYRKMIAYLSNNEVYVRDAGVCADTRYKMKIRVINQYPWSDLFAHNMFIRPTEDELQQPTPEWHLLCAPGFTADPATDGIPSGNFTILNFSKKIIIIGGTGFTGEMKKSIFTILNFLLPLQHEVLPMHCAANAGDNKEVALFFGLSGTGKTTLSAINNRSLIGDDEHGWSDHTIFNFEGGCYARTINLTHHKEPQIYEAIRFGSLLENIGLMPDGVTPDYTCSRKTENTRVSYPIEFAGNIVPGSVGNTPRHIIFLSCDAFGVLPPVSRLTNEQAAYYFICGYSAKIPGSEVGVTEPTAVFSPCFGAPFFLLHPTQYADLLQQKLAAGNITPWLINTGWIGGQYGAGKRIDLAYSRAIIKAVLEGSLQEVPYHTDNIFELAIPVSCPGVPDNILNPAASWTNQNSYDEKARQLLEKFQQNYSNYSKKQ
ncbi:phosphoenolpyruvate carboxykinase (ATP) [Chitinophaga silvisoli]|uniref:Phosphoenolpyruvate carboxykinase (ATP) n=1 Tax=Chitinophaga silvisoli TaxID=2291814 RepID=A0A3E1NZV4_9BACT|nr:phosphoenolpyruvate carboxykinase (ATP) [Chitinophaga silvisoli]RFM33486.1 phosphoenolpyruvate carboxykinase (ATP) [Chitinophaga silvisoli]